MNDGGVKSARRALAILELLSERAAALTFTEIGRALDYPRSSLHGLLRTLEESQWIEQDEQTRSYSLGIRAWQAGSAYGRAVGLADRARRFMEEVRDALDETVQLAVLDDGRHNVYIAKVDGAQLLVLEPPEQLRARLGSGPLERFTANTIADPEALADELARVRARGYALDNEEYTAGVRCVAVPVHDHTTAVVAGMSVSVPSIRFGDERREQALALLLRASAGLSAALGYRPA